MKHMKKFLAITVVLLAFTAASFAQVSATASATATILTPIAISNTVDMNFGNLAVNATPGTCVLATDNSRSVTGGVTLMAGGTVTAASFTVTGVAGVNYVITLPAAVTTVSDGTNTMTVNTWTSNPSGTGTLTGGTSTLLVGATLNVGGSQPAGVYNTANAGGSGEFTVTVNYQ
jgi:hypothetical protein